MKKLSVMFAALCAVLMPAAVYADVLVPGIIYIDHKRINLIPYILIIAIIIIAAVIISKSKNKKK